MLLRIALFALMAAGLLGFGAVAWFSSLPTPPPPEAKVAEIAPTPPPPPPPPVSIMVAAHPLRAGTFLKAADLHAEALPANQVPPGATADTPAARGQLEGAMLRHGVGEGQAVLSGDILRPGEHGFLAAVLEPGMRAMTLGLNEVASDWGLIWPGDRIDLILTQSFDAADTLARRHYAAETVLTKIRIVAVDQQLMQGEMADDAEHKATRTLTLEVSSAQAERLALALRLGKLVISLRSAATDVDMPIPPQVTPPQVTWSGDVARALSQPTRPPVPATVLLFRGNAGGASRS